MPTQSRKLIVLSVIVIALVGIGVFVFTKLNKAPEPAQDRVEDSKDVGPKYEVIGKSVEGRKIESYTYGEGGKHIVFVGGVHGGYEWNSTLLAYRFMDHLEANPTAVPENLTVTVIPTLNPDGLYRVVSKEGRFTAANVSIDKEVLATGRFNAHEVDLNRNFDCKWKPEATWQSRVVSAGTKAFSEPEAMALKTFVSENNPSAFIFWHSKANAVYASECKAGILPETLSIMNAYALASGYKPVKSFDAYEVTGDAEGWLASINIPAITVELETHESTEWDRNLAGIKALFNYYK